MRNVRRRGRDRRRLGGSATGHFVACEAKCGNNVEVVQARRYQALEARTVVRSTFVTLRQRADPTLEVVYVGLAENKERMLLSLNEAGVGFPLITMSAQDRAWDSEAASELLRGALATPATLTAPPASYIPFDHESDPEFITPH